MLSAKSGAYFRCLVKSLHFYDTLTHSHTMTPLGNKPFENTVGKGEIARNENFSFTHTVFYPFRELSAIFIKFKVVVCRLFQIGPV